MRLYPERVALMKDDSAEDLAERLEFSNSSIVYRVENETGGTLELEKHPLPVSAS